MTDLDKKITHTLFGKYSHNTIYLDDGIEFDCITYGKVKEQIEGKIGFFNIRWSDNIDHWIVYQYILL